MDQHQQQTTSEKIERSNVKSGRTSNKSPPYALFNLLVIVVAIAYGAYHQMYLAKDATTTTASESVDVPTSDDELEKMSLFTAEELKKFDGISDSKLYLSILGEIFDVTRGSKHYGPGEAYSAFVAKDISRAFVTGEFDAKSSKDSLDHVLALTPSELVSLKKWRDFYAENYDFVGRLIGRFYEETGDPTEYFWQIDRKIQFGIKQQEEEQSLKVEFPPCNVEYKADAEKTRFWCTTQSGGIERDWAGYPIQLFNQDEKTFTCVCAKKENFELPQLRPYENCDDATRSCFKQTEDQEQNNDD